MSSCVSTFDYWGFFLCLHQTCNIQIYLLFYCLVYMLVYGYLYIIQQIKLSFICFYQNLLTFTKKDSFIFLAIGFYNKVILKSRFCRRRNGYSWSASRFILKIVNIQSILHYHPFSIERDCGLPELSTYCCKILRIHHGLGIFIPPSFQSRWLTAALKNKNKQKHQKKPKQKQEKKNKQKNTKQKKNKKKIKHFIRYARSICKLVEHGVMGLFRIIIQSKQLL